VGSLDTAASVSRTLQTDYRQAILARPACIRLSSQAAAVSILSTSVVAAARWTAVRSTAPRPCLRPSARGGLRRPPRPSCRSTARSRSTRRSRSSTAPCPTSPEQRACAPWALPHSPSPACRSSASTTTSRNNHRNPIIWHQRGAALLTNSALGGAEHSSSWSLPK